MLKITSITLFAAVLVTAAACGEKPVSDEGPFTLVFSGTGYEPHNGQLLEIAVLDGTTVVASDSTTVAGGELSFTFADVLVKDKSYTVHYYADLDGSGDCTAPPADHGWSVAVDSVTADVTLTENHNTDFTDVCATFPSTNPGPFDLTFTGTGYTPHNGQTLHIAVVDTGDGSVVATDSTTVAGGALSFTFANALTKGGNYQIHYYADHDGSGACDAPPTDHAWSIDVLDVQDDATVTRDHDTDFTDVCSTFAGGPYALDFTGTGYGPHNGQILTVAIVDVADGSVVATDSTAVAGGAFSFTFPGLLVHGKAYEIWYYADHNGSGRCNVSPVDHSWVIPIAAATADVVEASAHNTNFTDVCSIFGDRALTFSGTGYTPHNGQTLSLVVVDENDDPVARDTVTVAAGTLDFSWPALLVDAGVYRIYYYADHDGSGACDAPPTDHGWLIDVNGGQPITADVAESRNHDTTFEATVCTWF